MQPKARLFVKRVSPNFTGSTFMLDKLALKRRALRGLHPHLNYATLPFPVGDKLPCASIRQLAIFAVNLDV